MKKLLTSERIATGLRIYGLLNFLIGFLQLAPNIISKFQNSAITSMDTITSLCYILVTRLLVLFLYFALALALETIVEIGTIIKSAKRPSQ